VGWVEREGHVYAFALNIDMPTMADANKRIPLAKALMRALGVLPAQ
jgi:beta-lactamase class D